MQLASSGARGLAGRTASHTLGTTSRSIHIASSVPRSAPVSTAQAVFKQTRHLLSRFVGHLTAPGTLRSPINSARALHSAPLPSRARSIQQGLSLPVRYALARPLHAPYLPRPPAVPRNTTQVGLGLARNFSTARPIFQSIADNVPVAGRAFCEADWDLKFNSERALTVPKKQGKTKENKKAQKETARPKQARKESPAAASPEETKQAELEHYFPAPVCPEVTTHLLIPLAPTPTSRLPLPLSPPTHPSTHPLLPLSMISSLHTDHATHSLRVSTLFARLDAARVFEEKGVTYSALGDPSGLCTVLEVKFSGWTVERVRSILGEAGTGWCVLEEERPNEVLSDQEAMEDVMSNMSFEDTGPPSQADMDVDPADSLMLPTLDFSASFPPQPNAWSPLMSSPSAFASGISTPLSDLEFHNAWSLAERRTESDVLSDSLSDVGSAGWSDAFSHMSGRSSVGVDSWVGLGFSSEFSGRINRSHSESSQGPGEAMF